MINADDIGGDAFTDDWAFLSSGDGAIGGVSLDYIAGATADLEVLTLGAGYVGPRGAYFHADQPHTSLFLDTVAELRAHDRPEGALDFLRYMKAGLSGFRWFLDEQADLAGIVGGTDATFARYRMVTPTGRVLTAQDAEATADSVAQETVSLTQLSQRDLWRIVDVDLRTQVRPTPQLYELSVTAHTKGYHGDLQPTQRGRQVSEEGGGGGITLGLVNLPERTWFGVPGGVRPHVAADAVFYVDDGDVHGTAFRGELSLNDPDTLVVFPYAQGAVQVSLEFTGAF